MSPSKARIAVFAGVLFSVWPAAAQPSATVELSAEEARCISDHKDDYLSVKRALIAVVPEICPDTGAKAVMQLAQNSSSDRNARVYWLNQPQLRCLVENIDLLLKQDASVSAETDPDHQADDEAVVSVSLECAN